MRRVFASTPLFAWMAWVAACGGGGADDSGGSGGPTTLVPFADGSSGSSSGTSSSGTSSTSGAASSGTSGHPVIGLTPLTPDVGTDSSSSGDSGSFPLVPLPFDAGSSWFAPSDGGLSGTLNFRRSSEIPEVDLNAVYGFDASHVWAVGAAGSVLFYDGVSWKSLRTGTETWNAVRAVDVKRVYIAGNGGLRGCSFDGGKTWKITTSPTLASFKAVSAVAAANRVEIGGTAGVAEGTTLDCIAWSNIVTIAQNFTASWTIGRYQTIATGTQGLIAKNWSENVVWGSPDYYAAWGSEPDDTYSYGTRVVLGDNASGLYSTESNEWHGTTFYGQPKPTRINAVWGANPSSLVAVGEGSSTAVGSISALYPVANPLPLPTSLRGVWGSSPNDVWVVGAGGTILHHP
jgi:hypothetical protein